MIQYFNQLVTQHTFSLFRGMSEGEVAMDSDNEIFLETENGQEAEASQGASKEVGPENSQGKGKTKKAKETNKKKEDPCIYCGKNCVKGCVQCAVCSLWSHMACTGLSKEAIKGLEIQAKEVGQAYWACRACMNFSNKWHSQMREVNRRQEETEARVDANTDKIEEVRQSTEELRREFREHVQRTEGIQERMEAVMDTELREREARRLNLVIHGLPEPSDSFKDARGRMEQDKIECERLFAAMKARTRYQAIRFCRRIGERGEDPRPLVFGVFTEEEKRHLLEKARELAYTKYENVTIVPDMTKRQRKGEQQLREEATRKNNQLTEEDKSKQLKWLVVGKRGEKRLIKGVEREGQGGRQERRTADPQTGWNPQVRVNMSDRGPNWRPDRRNYSQNWRPENHNTNGSGNNTGPGNNHPSNNGYRNGGQDNRGGNSRNSYNNSSNYKRSSQGVASYNGDNNTSSYSGNNRGGGSGQGVAGNNGGFSNSYGNRNNGFGNGGDNGGYNGNGTHNGGGRGGGFNENGTHNGGDSGGGSNHQLRQTELGARLREGGVWDQPSENTSNRDTDRQASQQAGQHVVEPRTNLHMRAPETIREIAPENRIQPPPLLPRPPIQRQQEVYLDQEQPGRNRLASNKRRWSHERDDEEEEQQQPPRSRRY